MGFKNLVPTKIGVNDAGGATIDLNMELVAGAHYPINALYRGGELQEPIRQLLDTVGNGTGTTNANGDYSSTQGVFKLVPSAGVVYRIHELAIVLRDGTAGNWASDKFGAEPALTNGIGLTLELNNGGSIEKELLGGEKFKANIDFQTYGFTTNLQQWSADTSLMAVFNFRTSQGEALRLDGTALEDIRVRLDDNMTAFTEVTFFASGYVE